MTVLLPFLLNAGMNFLLGLFIAYFLGPAEFGRYAIGAAIVVLVNTALLDWLRQSTVRFYSATSREQSPEIRATLDVLAAGMSLGLCALLAAALLTGMDLGLPTLLLCAAVLGGIGAGLFDYQGAIARARFHDAAYARLIIVKNLMALVLMVGGAWLTRDPALVLFGGLLSVMAALASLRGSLSDGPLSLARARPEVARGFLVYALPLVAGNAIYSLIPLLNRWLLANAHGYAEAGYFSLASDMGLRLFATLAAMLEIVLLREVIRLDESRGRRAAQRRIAANFVVVLMVALPAAVGLWLVLPAFDRLIVPPAFQGRFAAYMALLLPGFAAITLFHAGLYPVFLIGKRTLVATAAAVAALAVNLVLLAIAPVAGPMGYAVAQTAAFLTVVVVTGIVAWRGLPVAWPWRDAGLVILATVLMGLAIAPLRGALPPLPELALQLALGALVYGATLLACNVAHCRTRARLWLVMRRGR